MTNAQLSALVRVSDAADSVSRVIRQAQISTHQLELPPEVLRLLIEAQQALFAAQRVMEG